jgi:hypothetical protein
MRQLVFIEIIANRFVGEDAYEFDKLPSSEMLLTDSLTSGHEPAKLWAEKKDRIKSRNSFFID